MAGKINVNFVNEYEEFLREYVLPLIGIDTDTDNLVLERHEQYLNEQVPTMEQQDERLYFNVSGWRVFSIPCQMKIPPDVMSCVRRILQSFPDVSQYKKTGASRYLPTNFPYEVQKKSLYRNLVQEGLCQWLAGDIKNNSIRELFDELETWSVKTYEGKKVTMGFVINLDATSTFGVGNQKWLHFMHDDASAMLTDCIHSVIELDVKCNFISYHSLSENGQIEACKLDHNAPLRFLPIMQKYVDGKVNGVFLLGNGDIVLAKNQKVRFVKRNLRWLNMSYSTFENALEKFVRKNKDEGSEGKIEELIKSIFASVLDVSFSHAGGIIAVVGKTWPDTDNNSILAPCDDLLNVSYDMEAMAEDIRTLKRAVILEMVENKTFQEMDRKLRSELLGLDGACILNCEGKVHSFGAIIQNDSGAIGGGEQRQRNYRNMVLLSRFLQMDTLMFLLKASAFIQ